MSVLRALSAGVTAPTRGAPLVLREAWAESGRIPFLWRLRYQLPATDPRFLEQTEEDMAQDLLLHAFYELRTRPPEAPADGDEGLVEAAPRYADGVAAFWESRKPRTQRIEKIRLTPSEGVDRG